MKLPIKIVVFNNSVLGFCGDGNESRRLPTDGTELQTPISRVSKPAVLPVSRVKSRRRRSATAFSDGPVLPTVVAKEELAIPPQIKLEQAKGFSLYMLRAIISGRGDEVTVKQTG